MRLIKLGKIALTILAVSSLFGCKTEDVPENTPYLLHDQGNGLCARYKLTDPVNVVYTFDKSAPCTDVNGGWAFPPGQLEAVLQYIRDQKKACDAAQNPPPTN